MFGGNIFIYECIRVLTSKLVRDPGYSGHLSLCNTPVAYALLVVCIFVVALDGSYVGEYDCCTSAQLLPWVVVVCVLHKLASRGWSRNLAL